MENNEIVKEKSAGILWLDKNNACFKEKNGFLTLILNDKGEEKIFDRVFLHRAFPHEFLFESYSQYSFRISYHFCCSSLLST